MAKTRERRLEELEWPSEHPAAMDKALELAEKLQQGRDR